MKDLTLDSILYPAITGYNPPFGTRVTRTVTNEGGLSSREVNTNILTPFGKMRAIEVTSNDSTSEVEYDAKIIINNESDSIQFTLNNATYIGCKVTIINKSTITHTLLCSSVRTTGNNVLQGLSVTELMWNGTAWQSLSAPAIKDRVIQYPQEIHPQDLYPCTEWQEILYNGAFFRTYKSGVSRAFSEENESLQKQDAATNVNGISFVGESTDFSNTRPDWSVTYDAGMHSHTITEIENPHYRSSGQTYSNNPKIYKGNAMPNISQRSYSPTYKGIHFKTSTTIGLSGDHRHYITPKGTIKSRDSETRPKNYTFRVWERIN